MHNFFKIEKKGGQNKGNKNKLRGGKKFFSHTKKKKRGSHLMTDHNNILAGCSIHSLIQFLPHINFVLNTSYLLVGIIVLVIIIIIISSTSLLPYYDSHKQTDRQMGMWIGQKRTKKKKNKQPVERWIGLSLFHFMALTKQWRISHTNISFHFHLFLN